MDYDKSKLAYSETGIPKNKVGRFGKKGAVGEWVWVEKNTKQHGDYYIGKRAWQDISTSGSITKKNRYSRVTWLQAFKIVDPGSPLLGMWLVDRSLKA